jgi:hypothetical protein
MAGSAPGDDIEFLDLKDSSPKNITNITSQLDKSIYKQLFIFLTIALVIAAGFYLYLRFGQESVVREQTKPVETASRVEEKKDSETQTRFSADQQRKNDIALINSALKSYFLDKNKAPQSLDGLVPDKAILTNQTRISLVGRFREHFQTARFLKLAAPKIYYLLITIFFSAS